MNEKINQCQQRLFNKLFVTLPGVRNAKNFNKGSKLDLKITNFYCFKNKDFWFTKSENDNAYLFLFGIKDKPLKDIRAKDTCLILDFDKNIQFNKRCLGLFGIENSQIQILINYELLKERYPNIDVDGFKISYFKAIDDSSELKVINLGYLNEDFIVNLDKLINAASNRKSQNKSTSQKIKKDNTFCEICSKEKNNFKIDSKLNNLKSIRPELCGRCIEKIVVSEFYTKVTPLLKSNLIEELDIAKEKFGNDYMFDIGLKLLEKYGVIQFIGVKKLFFTIDTSSYLVKKYLKYSDKNNLLMDNIRINNSKSKNKPSKDRSIKEKINKDNSQVNTTKKQMEIVINAIRDGKSREDAAKLANIPLYKIVHWYNEGRQGTKPENINFFNELRELENNKKSNGLKRNLNELNRNNSENNKIKLEIPSLIKFDSFGNKNTITQMNNILKDLANGKSEAEAIKDANVSEETYKYWINRGKQDFGKLYVQFYNYVNQLKSDDPQSIENLDEDEVLVDNGIYEPLLEEYEDSFTFNNNSGIAWVNKTGSKWYYSRKFNGKIIKLSAYTIPELYNQVINQDLIWGIIDYDKAKNFIDIPEDFEIPKKETDVGLSKFDQEIYAPLPAEYLNSFSSTNKSGIAWVSRIGKKWIYTKRINGKTVKFDDDDIYGLFVKVKNANQIWGIRDYDKAKLFIDIPDDFEVPLNPQVDEPAVNVDVDSGIYAPLPEEYENSFSSMNKSGIAWTNQIGKKWIYTKRINGKTVKFDDDDIYGLYVKVKNANQIWGIRDYDKAKLVIDIPDDFKIPLKPQVEEPAPSNSFDILDPLPEKYLSSFNPSQKNRTGIAWVNKIGNRWVYQRKVNGVKINFDDKDICNLHKIVIKNNQIWGILDFDKAMPIIESNKLESEVSKPQISTNYNVIVNYIEKPMGEVDIIIKGVIKSKDLIFILNKFELFKEDIKRIITTSLNNEVDMFIELEIKKSLKNKFEEEIRDLGWKIN